MPKETVTSSTVEGGSSASPPDGTFMGTAPEQQTTSTSQGGFADSAPGRYAESAPDGDGARELKREAAKLPGRGLYLPPDPTPKLMAPPGGWIYWMSWGDIRIGDCTMWNPIAYIYSDAMVFFQSETSSSDDDDVWLMLGIQFSDQSHQPVGHPIPKHVGMPMAWEGSRYPLTFWDSIPGVTPSGAAQIRHGSITNHC
jgi:hypothetical protein